MFYICCFCPGCAGIVAASSCWQAQRRRDVDPQQGQAVQRGGDEDEGTAGPGEGSPHTPQEEDRYRSTDHTPQVVPMHAARA